MAGAGTVIDDGTLRLEFLVTASDSDGVLHEMRATYAPESPWAFSHLHPAQDERFEVVEGTLEFLMDGRLRRVQEGETLEIPRGCVHQARNPGPSRAVAIWQTRPALRTGEFLLAVDAARRAEDLEALLEVVDEHDDVFVLAEQPAG
jgi:mannose-6-phosphate isomerase-like protein (cupin superfamily)